MRDDIDSVKKRLSELADLLDSVNKCNKKGIVKINDSIYEGYINEVKTLTNKLRILQEESKRANKNVSYLMSLVYKNNDGRINYKEANSSLFDLTDKMRILKTLKKDDKRATDLSANIRLNVEILLNFLLNVVNQLDS